jgi:hypothetical protein
MEMYQTTLTRLTYYQDLYIAFQLTIPFHPRQYQYQSVEYRLSGAYWYLHFCLKNCLISIAHWFRHVPFSLYVFLHIHKVEYGMCIH